ncbi:MAG TPA: isochorismatase family protein [Nitrososphaeraceae archaeon]|jgi:nicotinamidase-related amidase|nr:isochorismatase family protein [Nitrososphaeraceae archaeon]
MNGYITPDREHSALLIVDVQRDFTLMGAIAEIPGTLQAVQYIQRLVQVYRERDYPIIHIIRLYHADESNVDLCRRQAIENGKQVVIPGSDGAELMDVYSTLHLLFNWIQLYSSLVISSKLELWNG